LQSPPRERGELISVPPNASKPTPRTLRSFDAYLDDLVALLQVGAVGELDAYQRALDGEVSQVLRANVPLSQRRDEGAFFTPHELAEELVADARKEIVAAKTVFDPACGAGDLLLAAARVMPVADSVEATVRDWGCRIVGRDINEEYVRAARIRLAMLAEQRVQSGWSGSEADLETLLPEVRVGDGLAPTLADSQSVVLMNPPFGAIDCERPWGSGRVSRAAAFFTDRLETLPRSVRVLAILPDVLRSGSNYQRWRDHVRAASESADVRAWGRFDRWADVDVFLLSTTVGAGMHPIAWWPTPDDTGTVGDDFEVRVGTVVPHRDPHEGPTSPYLRVAELPMEGVHRPTEVTRRHQGRRFLPPFVAIRRTSRPGQTRARAVANVVVGDDPVLVENHLIVCIPRSGGLESCEALVRTLGSDSTTRWLDERLRCRHLTVTAVAGIPASLER
jgi:predicted RNA methylase